VGLQPGEGLVQASEPASAVRLSKVLRRVLVLLVVSVAINYFDRGSLSIAAPALKDELGISVSQLGILLSALFWTYASFQIIAGWLVDRFPVEWVLAGGFFLWSLAECGTGVARGFAGLLVLQLLLGMGESVAYPSYSKILAEHFVEHQRGFANACIDAGAKCGPALGTLLGGLFMARFGWRPIFIVLGLGSLIWLPLWYRWTPRSPRIVRQSTNAIVGIGAILIRRDAWATFIGHFCSNYFWYFVLTWLPFYLVRERHFSLSKMATIGAGAYLLTGAVTTLTGLISDRLIAGGATPTRIRKTCMGAGMGFAPIIVVVALVPDRATSMIFLLIACMSYGVYSSSHWATTQTIAGPLAAGKWSGLQNFIANLAGVVAPLITGVVVERTGQFFWAFAIAAAVALVGAIVYVFVLGRIEPVDWRRELLT
jgi:ACS family D-galactonate transporter-like MFS transporter